MIASGSTIGAALASAPIDIFEARILLAHALGLTRVQLITSSERSLDASEAERINNFFARRRAGEPIAYLLGQREFYGLSLHVSPAVLIPRPETELLVELSSERIAPHARVLDLGTGSGAIAVVLSHLHPDADFTATDMSRASLAVARQNVERHAVRVRLLHGDWYQALDGDTESGRFDLIVANPPYIEANDPHLAQGDLRFEPVHALTDRLDGLSALTAIITGAPEHLSAGGWLLMEHGYNQAEAVRACLQTNGFSDVQSWRDLAGIERVTGGKLS